MSRWPCPGTQAAGDVEARVPNLIAQPYEGPAAFHVDHAVYSIAHLRIELQPSRSMGPGFGRDRAVVIVLERGDLPKTRTSMGELRLGDRQELATWWTGFRFEL